MVTKEQVFNNHRTLWFALRSAVAEASAFGQPFSFSYEEVGRVGDVLASISNGFDNGEHKDTVKSAFHMASEYLEYAHREYRRTVDSYYKLLEGKNPSPDEVESADFAKAAATIDHITAMCIEMGVRGLEEAYEGDLTIATKLQAHSALLFNSEEAAHPSVGHLMEISV